MSSELISLGYSPCPNDTFIFHALVHGLADRMGLKLAEPVMEDVESLNEWAREGRLDVTKISCHALGYVLDEYQLLSSGAALGRGCGPLLISTGRNSEMDLTDLPIAIPGRLTTAALLMKLYAPECRNLVPMRFDRIIQAVELGQVAAGVIIHESRFTYMDHGLVCRRDLGAWWEKTSGYPIPLGCIVARRSLGEERLDLMERGIRESVRQAFANRDSSRQYIKAHARELDDRVIDEHIGLYVNDFSIDLGKEGLMAIDYLLERGRRAALFPNLP